MYEIWLGVALINEWLRSNEKIKLKNEYWLEEQIGQDVAGIFDDIVLYKNNEYSFYQVKHTINPRGDFFSLDDFYDPENEISIKKMCESLIKIKNNLSPENYRIILYSNKIADKELGDRIDSNLRFNNTIRNLNPNARGKNKEIIEKLKEISECSKENLSELLNHLYFYLNQSNLDGLESKVRLMIGNNKLKDCYFNYFRKSLLFKMIFTVCLT